MQYAPGNKVNPLFFTSVTSNYLPKAAVLADSLRKHSPGSPVYVLLCDELPPELQAFAGRFDRVLRLQEMHLSVPNLPQWIFKHSAVELCTAVKGPFIQYAFEGLNAAKVIYLDPDIVVLDSLGELSSLLDRHSIIVTPHLETPENHLDAILDNEICSLKHGVFNLGFLAVRNSPEGNRFARWWSERLLRFCYDDIPGGLFTDQRWLDLAPCFFSDLHVLRDKTYNVATWNLSQRKVKKRADGSLCIDGRPIKFFHFSGFDSGDQLTMLRKYGQDSPELFELRDWYVQELERAGHSRFAGCPWAYGTYSHGVLIQPEHRRIYRSRQDLMAAFPDPAMVNEKGRSFYRWCLKNIPRESEPAMGRNGKLRLLKRWRRSVMKRIGYAFP
jgi:hypothetical protein